MVTNQDNLIFQSLYTVLLIKELNDAKQHDSTFFAGLPLSQDVMSVIGEVGVDNQGCLLMFLYALLVIPREVIEDTFKTEYNEIDKLLYTWKMKTVSTYDREPPHKYIRHIRNAVAHGRVSFEPKVLVKFEDEYTDKKTKKLSKFSAEMPLSKVGEFLNLLIVVHQKYSAARCRLP